MKSLAAIANETLSIVERGVYTTFSGQDVNIRAEIDAAIAGTVLYRPEELIPSPSSEGGLPVIEIWAESTGGAIRRLAAEGPVAALVFASAKNPGGGFLGNVRAQEEDISRCSAHYICVQTQPDYYAANRNDPSMLYTDHIIYAPLVPYFRDDQLNLADSPILVSLVTAPAPNAGEYLRKDPKGNRELIKALNRRVGQILHVFAHQNQRTIVLGAWGCGVFRNDPFAVANAFKSWLDAPEFRGAFDRVVFAIYERDEAHPIFRIFQGMFNG